MGVRGVRMVVVVLVVRVIVLVVELMVVPVLGGAVVFVAVVFVAVVLVSVCVLVFVFVVESGGRVVPVDPGVLRIGARTHEPVPVARWWWGIASRRVGTRFV